MTLSLAEEPKNIFIDAGEEVTSAVLEPLASDERDTSARGFQDYPSCIKSFQTIRDRKIEECKTRLDEQFCKQQALEEYEVNRKKCDDYRENTRETSSSPFEDKQGPEHWPY